MGKDSMHQSRISKPLLNRSDIYTRITMNRLSYTEARNKSKLNMFASFFMLFKSTVGLGMFSYPYVFSKVGIGYGVIFGAFICYITSYGMYCLANQANEVERRDYIKIKSFDGRT